MGFHLALWPLPLVTLSSQIVLAAEKRIHRQGDLKLRGFTGETNDFVVQGEQTFLVYHFKTLTVWVHCIFVHIVLFLDLRTISWTKHDQWINKHKMTLLVQVFIHNHIFYIWKYVIQYVKLCISDLILEYLQPVNLLTQEQRTMNYHQRIIKMWQIMKLLV